MLINPAQRWKDERIQNRCGALSTQSATWAQWVEPVRPSLLILNDTGIFIQVLFSQNYLTYFHTRVGHFLETLDVSLLQITCYFNSEMHGKTRKLLCSKMKSYVDLLSAVLPSVQNKILRLESMKLSFFKCSKNQISFSLLGHWDGRRCLD